MQDSELKYQTYKFTRLIYERKEMSRLVHREEANKIEGLLKLDLQAKNEYFTCCFLFGIPEAESKKWSTVPTSIEYKNL